MKTNHERRRQECGNAMVYVLIAIVLFAGLSFIMARQGGEGETTVVSDEKTQLYATQMISYAAQVQQVIDQMIFSHITIDDLDFMLPDDADFETPPNIHKVYHPDGGGLIARKNNPPDAFNAAVGGSPTPGWYFGRFNNVEWSPSGGMDAVLVAYMINPTVCEAINMKVTGSATIPVVAADPKRYFIDDATPGWGAGANTDFMIATCATCENIDSLCVRFGTTHYAFYSYIAKQ